MNKATRQTLAAIKAYNLIEKGDALAIGVSGGKDSLILLDCLYKIKKYILDFKLIAITIDLGFTPPQDFSDIKKWCEERQIPYHIKPTKIYNIVFEVRREKNPCSLCSNMRGAALHDTAKALGCNKVALAHHLDDAIVTFMMNLLNEGRVGCFYPKTWLSRKEITLIRPLCLVKEQTIESSIQNFKLKPVTNPCPSDKNSSRQDTKRLLKILEDNRPYSNSRISNAVKTLWGV